VPFVSLTTLVASALQSATGFGFALLLSPVAFAIYAPAHAVGTVLLLGAALNLLMLYGERRAREVRWKEVLILVVGAVPGLAAGLLILDALSKPTLQIVVGIAIVLATLAHMRRPPTMADSGSPSPGRRLLGGGVGVLTGILTTTTGANGPPPMIWFHRAGATPAEFRDSLSAVYLALNALGALTLVLFGHEHPKFALPTIAVLLVLTAAGRWIGRKVFERADAERFDRVGTALILLAGLASIVIGATS
jgi:uncharacterized membrane protein YfcA